VEPEALPDLRDLFAVSDYGWCRQAACRDEPDDTLFLSDKTLPHNQPGSPSILLALLICAGCPVRRECLLEAMTPIVSPFQGWDPETEKMRESGPTGSCRPACGAAPRRPSGCRWGTSPSVRPWSVWSGASGASRHRGPSLRTKPGATSGEERSSGPARDPLAKREVAVLLAVTRRRCVSCSRRLPALARSDARYCSGRCRVSAHRARAA
jgi:hypothetical protein